MNEIPSDSNTTELQTRQWAVFLHVAQLGNFLLPLGGLVAVIVIWQMKKAELPGIDPHARMVLNWQISAFIYGVIGTVLIIIGIGVLILLALAICALVFAIIGAIKANDGVLWKYPLTFPILK